VLADGGDRRDRPSAQLRTCPAKLDVGWRRATPQNQTILGPLLWLVVDSTH